MMKEQAKVLEEEKRELKSVRDLAQEQFKAIQQLGKELDSKQDLIKSLVEQSMKARRDIDTAMRSNLSFVEKFILPHEKIIPELKSKVENFIQKELRAFDRVQLQQIQKTGLQGYLFLFSFNTANHNSDSNTPISEMFINQLHKSPELQPLVKAWNFDTVNAPDEFLPHVADICHQSNARIYLFSFTLQSRIFNFRMKRVCFHCEQQEHQLPRGTTTTKRSKN